VLRVPALLRPGALGRLRQMSLAPLGGDTSQPAEPASGAASPRWRHEALRARAEHCALPPRTTTEAPGAREPRQVAIVGGGLAGFVAHATLRQRRVEDVTVFDPSGGDPAGAWRRRAEAIRQRRMRSESDGHCLPTSFPGLAVRSALRQGHPWPIVQSLCDRY